MNGQKVTADRSVTTTEDPCVTCKCNNNKQLTCAKLACPILNCPNAKIVRDPGKCCPHCIGKESYIFFINRDESRVENYLNLVHELFGKRKSICSTLLFPQTRFFFHF